VMKTEKYVCIVMINTFFVLISLYLLFIIYYLLFSVIFIYSFIYKWIILEIS
jgi:hypothetical protein